MRQEYMPKLAVAIVKLHESLDLLAQRHDMKNNTIQTLADAVAMLCLQTFQLDNLESLLASYPMVRDKVLLRMRPLVGENMFKCIAQSRATRTLRLALTIRSSADIRSSEDEEVQQFVRQYFWRKAIVDTFTTVLVLTRSKSFNLFHLLDTFICLPNIMNLAIVD